MYCTRTIITIILKYQINVKKERRKRKKKDDAKRQIPKWNFGQDILISALSNPQKAPTATAHLEYMLEWTAHMNTPAAIRVKSSANNVQLWVRVDFDRESVERFMTIDS